MLEIGYDAAYLEMSHALSALGDEDPALLVGALPSAEDPAERNPVPGAAFWTKDLIERLRSTLGEWRGSKHRRRIDEVDRQLALCRVAAGINWANKPIQDSWRIAALCYAGWAVRQYLKTHEPKAWGSIGASPRVAAQSRADDDLWSELWQATNGFDPTAGKYVLVAEGLKAEPALRALGQLPWPAVIDLDPSSDIDGLHRYRRRSAPLVAHSGRT